MWRSAFIVVLMVGSSALAGEARSVLHVGITITGTGARAPAKTAASVGGEQATVGGAGAAVVKRSPRARLAQ